MKNINKYLLASTLALGTMLTGCEDEVLVPVEDNAAATELSNSISALQTELFEYNLERKTVTVRNAQLENKLDSLSNSQFFDAFTPSTKVQYTINVLSSSNAYNARIAGVSGASVTVSQGGNVVTKETDSGLAVFSDLIPGRVNVTITAPDHATVEMTVWLYNETFVGKAENYNVSTQVALYPTAGENMATIKGALYANTTTLNDTLDRKYADNTTIFGNKAGTYIAKPGPYVPFYNPTQENGQTPGSEKIQVGNVYNSHPAAGAIQFEAAPANFQLFAVARPTYLNYAYGDEASAGQITQITYNSMVFPVTITEGNMYSVNVPSTTKGGISIEFQSPELVADHTRFTRNANFDYDGDGLNEFRDVVGGSNETGSKEVTVKYFNRTENTVNLHTLAADDADHMVSVESNKSGNVVRRVITEEWVYAPVADWGNVNADLKPSTVNLWNIYLWPVRKPVSQGSDNF